MNSFRKTLKCILSVAAILAYCIQPALADDAELPVLGTVSDVVIENFENVAEGESALIVNEIDPSYLTIIDGGDTVLELSNSEDGVNKLNTKAITITAGFKYEFSYDVRFTQIPDTALSGGIKMGYRGSDPTYGYITAAYNGTDGGYRLYDMYNGTWIGKTIAVTDKWYTVKCVVENGKTYTSLIDKSNGRTLVNGASGNKQSVSGTVSFCLINIPSKTSTDPDVTLQINNAELVMYSGEDALNIVSTSISDGDEDVRLNPQLRFGFFQKMSDESQIIVKKVVEDREETVTSSLSASGRDLVVTFPQLLERDTEYKIYFESVLTASGDSCSVDAISFKTEIVHIFNDLTVLSLNDTNEGSEISFIINDPYEYPNFTGAVMAAVYKDNQMLALDISVLSNVVTGTQQSIVFELGSVPADAQVELMLFDTESGPLPLAYGILRI